MNLYTIRGVAALKGCSPMTVRRAIRAGGLAATRVPGTGQYLIVDADAEAWTPKANGEGLKVWNEARKGRVTLERNGS